MADTMEMPRNETWPGSESILAWYFSDVWDGLADQSIELEQIDPFEADHGAELAHRSAVRVALALQTGRRLDWADFPFWSISSFSGMIGAADWSAAVIRRMVTTTKVARRPGEPVRFDRVVDAGLERVEELTNAAFDACTDGVAAYLDSSDEDLVALNELWMELFGPGMSSTPVSDLLGADGDGIDVRTLVLTMMIGVLAEGAAEQVGERASA